MEKYQKLYMRYEKILTFFIEDIIRKVKEDYNGEFIMSNGGKVYNSKKHHTHVYLCPTTNKEHLLTYMKVEDLYIILQAMDRQGF